MEGVSSVNFFGDDISIYEIKLRWHKGLSVFTADILHKSISIKVKPRRPRTFLPALQARLTTVVGQARLTMVVGQARPNGSSGRAIS